MVPNNATGDEAVEAAYKSLFSNRNVLRNDIPRVRSFSSSFCVQSQLQQAHGSVPFSCRQLRPKWASFTLSRSKYSSQIRPLFGQRQITKTSLDPLRHSVFGYPRLLHVVQVFVAGD